MFVEDMASWISGEISSAKLLIRRNPSGGSRQVSTRQLRSHAKESRRMQVQSQPVTSGRATDAAGRTHYGDIRRTQPSVESSTAQARQASTTSHETRATSVKTRGVEVQQDQLYAEFRPLVRRLIRQYGENAEIRNDLEGEIYYRFCVLLKAFDPNRGIPLRPYLVRQLSASIYTFARHHWR